MFSSEDDDDINAKSLSMFDKAYQDDDDGCESGPGLYGFVMEYYVAMLEREREEAYIYGQEIFQLLTTMWHNVKLCRDAV